MKCGDSTIDDLLEGNASVPIVPGENSPAVGYLQDLLRGHGYGLVDDPRSAGYGVYDSRTSVAVGDYRRKHGLDPSNAPVNAALLRDLIARPAPQAAVGPAYVPLVLDAAFSPTLRFVWLTSLFETGGVFGRLNLNTDACGVSFGILQWSQRAGRLNEFLRACATREPAEWIRVMGDGSHSILDFTGREKGGLDDRGFAVDPAFELTKDPWKSRLHTPGASLLIQRLQLDLASEVYRAELARTMVYATAINSERGFGFLLDLTNQVGPGRVEQQYKLAARPGATEADILKTLEEAFTAIANPLFRPQVRARREFFRATGLLSGDPLPHL